MLLQLLIAKMNKTIQRERERKVCFFCVLQVLRAGIYCYDGDMMEMKFVIMYMMRRNDNNWKGLGFCCAIVY